MTYTAIDDVAASLRLRGVRVDSDIVRFEAGNVVAMRDLDGLPTYVHDFPPDMLEGSLRDAPHGRPASDAALVAGGHGIVYVSNMDRAIRFYTSVLGLTLTNRFDDHFATVETGALVLAIHPHTPRSQTPGVRGAAVLGLSVDEPIERVVSRLTSLGVRMNGSPRRSELGSTVEIEDPDGNPVLLREAEVRPSGSDVADSVAIGARP